MSRKARLHHPGSAFHIVARTQGHAAWFVDEIKAGIADILLREVHNAGARAIAFAIMDNHYHLILLQGREPLGRVLQPAQRRIALLVQRRHKLVGHVFERSFRSKVCSDAEHLPNAIMYVHRNPVKAGVCRSATDYEYSSARAFEGKCHPGLLCVDDGLRAFDPDGVAGGRLEGLRDAYRDRMRRLTDEELDGYWDWFCKSVRLRKGTAFPPMTPHRDRALHADLRDAALRILATIDPDIPRDLVRSRNGGHHIVAVRRQLIAALHQRGYPGVAIARYLRVSEATVSKVRSAMRWAQISAAEAAQEAAPDPSPSDS